jgi:Electron transfer DM13
MKKLVLAFFSLIVLTSACSKITTSDMAPVVISSTDKVLSSGSFVNGAHATSGSVKLIESADKKKYLVFDNLKSDAGPDLRIYLAEDNAAKVYTEITNKVVNGNSKLEVPTSANTDKQKIVMVWCKQFSVLFGSADLK